MPIEFATAAYRFGHSLVRNAYSINPVSALTTRTPATRCSPAWAGRPGRRAAAPDGGPARRLSPDAGPPDRLEELQRGPVRRRRSRVPACRCSSSPAARTGCTASASPCSASRPPGRAPAPGRACPSAAPSGAAPSGSNSIAYRDFVREFFYLLPSGQDVAAAYGLTPIAPAAIVPATVPGFSAGTPLFLYVLYEAFPPTPGHPRSTISTTPARLATSSRRRSARSAPGSAWTCCCGCCSRTRQRGARQAGRRSRRSRPRPGSSRSGPARVRRGGGPPVSVRFAAVRQS